MILWKNHIFTVGYNKGHKFKRQYKHFMKRGKGKQQDKTHDFSGAHYLGCIRK